ncbi:hypothetical protein TNCV_2377431 [Trichonephila clavipes]|nr:hypothetical protein TNCV_2377431 [Trichonephila clavipes]
MLQCEILSGDKSGESVFIPRITLDTAGDLGMPFALKRTQFLYSNNLDLRYPDLLEPGVTQFSNLVDSSFVYKGFFPITETQAESEPKIGNGIEEIVDLSRQINLERDSDDVQELLGFPASGGDNC